MTSRFVEIRNNLNEHVQQRTREVVRSEQLASVGFLAAGVAHEINNHWLRLLGVRKHSKDACTRFSTQRQEGEQPTHDEQELNVLRRYLKRIQDEAFRCKGITERLLDFSRLQESQRNKHRR